MTKIVLRFLFAFAFFNGFGQIDQSAISNAISENQDLNKIDSIAKLLNYKGGEKVKVFTRFRISGEGKIIDIQAKGPHSFFEDEAIRIIKKLPDFEPAEYNGKPISPSFALPMIFVIETQKQKKKRLKKEAN